LNDTSDALGTEVSPVTADIAATTGRGAAVVSTIGNDAGAQAAAAASTVIGTISQYIDARGAFAGPGIEGFACMLCLLEKDTINVGSAICIRIPPMLYAASVVRPMP
jgi:hypothetical protein